MADSHISCPDQAVSVLPAKGTAFTALARYLETIQLWAERVQQRRALHQMSDHLMKDIGLSRADAYLEVRKHPWQA